MLVRLRGPMGIKSWFETHDWWHMSEMRWREIRERDNVTYLAETRVELEATAESAASLSVENPRDVKRDHNRHRCGRARCPSIDEMRTECCWVRKL